MSSKVLETTCKIYKGQGNYLNKWKKSYRGRDERISRALLLLLLLLLLLVVVVP